MYGTVSEICIQLLKVYENNEKIAVILWNEEDVYESGAAFNPTAPDVDAVLQAIGEADCEVLCRHGIGQNFVGGELRRLAALRQPRQIAIPENELRILLPLMQTGMCSYNDVTGEVRAALDTLELVLDFPSA
jgi:hypothetical protein